MSAGKRIVVYRSVDTFVCRGGPAWPPAGDHSPISAGRPYVRPDHGRMIWGETGKPGYGLFDRALGATYINGLFEALEKELAK